MSKPTVGISSRLTPWAAVVLGAPILWGCVFEPAGVAPPVLDAGVVRDAQDRDALSIDWCDRDSDGFQSEDCGGADCDDHDPLRFPENPEVCDGADNNCNGDIDEGLAGGVDADGDGYTFCQGDCNDNDPTVYPYAPERCDGRDNDCDGDSDGDADCDGDGFSFRGGDCDDDDLEVYPYAPEICDGKDNDCDGDIDGDADCDGDGYSFRGGDCDDNDLEVYPWAPELCDGKDNDCNTQIDEDCI
jgi:Putative metal-binding motif